MKVTIIIPNYNGKHFMEPCLQSLSEQTCRDFKVLVVDNASSDGSLEYMSEHYPDIEVISLKKNYGFSKAVNVGIEHSTTPYVILLNNDTTVDTHYVEEMIKAIEKSPRIFSVSSKMIQMYHPELIDSAGDLYTLMGWACAAEPDVLSPITQKQIRYLPHAPGQPSTAEMLFQKSAYLMKTILHTLKISMSDTVQKFTATKIYTVPQHLSTM